MTNSRLKDYLDLWILLSRETLDAKTLAQAITATFKRRGMPVPTNLPIGLTDEFANDISRQAIWFSFLTKNQLATTPLSTVVTFLRTTLKSVLIQAAG
jgi:hypothetical protein